MKPVTIVVYPATAEVRERLVAGLTKAMVRASEDAFKDCNVTALSTEDEIHRLELIECALEEDDSAELIREILDAEDIQDKTIEDFMP